MAKLITFLALIVVVVFIAAVVLTKDTPYTPTQAAAAPAGPAVEPANPKLAAQCLKAMKSATGWKILPYDSEHVTVEVGPAFYLANFSSKVAFDSLVRCYTSEGRKKEQGLKSVEYLDFRNHHEVARWSKWTGFEVE